MAHYVTYANSLFLDLRYASDLLRKVVVLTIHDILLSLVRIAKG